MVREGLTSLFARCTGHRVLTLWMTVLESNTNRRSQQLCRTCWTWINLFRIWFLYKCTITGILILTENVYGLIHGLFTGNGIWVLLKCEKGNSLQRFYPHTPSRSLSTWLHHMAYMARWTPGVLIFSGNTTSWPVPCPFYVMFADMSQVDSVSLSLS